MGDLSGRYDCEMARQVVCAGYARMPERTPARSTQQHLTIGVRVDVGTHTVVHVSTSMGTVGGADWVEQRLLGTNLLDPDPPFIRAVERDYWALAQGAILQCYRDLVRRYRQGLEREGLLPPGSTESADPDLNWEDEEPPQDSGKSHV